MIEGDWRYLDLNTQRWCQSSNSNDWFTRSLVPNPCYVAPPSRDDATHVTQQFINTGCAIASHYKMIDNVWYYWSDARQYWKLSDVNSHRTLVPLALDEISTTSISLGANMLDEIIVNDINPEYEDSIKFRRHLTDISVVFTSENQNAGAALISKEKATELRDFLTRWIDS
jgi:hypothetical protein